jgi:GNAT superfamily N-acetyltransferase
MNKIDISKAQSVEEILKCFPVMRELRTHITDEDDFVRRVQRQHGEGYLLAYVEANGEVRACAGYRYLEMLYAGKMIYVDDLVTRAVDRSLGYGAQLFDWLMNEARTHGCAELHLDSGVQRFDAHRFYLAKRMKISSHHFAISVTP